MNNKALKIAEISIAFLMIILAILSVYEVVPLYIYAIIASAVGLYYFPFRVFLLAREAANNPPIDLRKVLSAFVLSSLLGFSIAVLFLQGEKGFFYNILGVFSIVNAILVIYFVVQRKYHFQFWMHLEYGFLVSYLLFHWL